MDKLDVVRNTGGRPGRKDLDPADVCAESDFHVEPGKIRRLDCKHKSNICWDRCILLIGALTEDIA